MLGLHMPELIVILVIALLIFGPKKLPEMGSSVGRTIKQFREGMSEMSQSKPEKPAETKAIEPEASPKLDAPFFSTKSDVAPEVVNSEVGKTEIPVE
ncbi:MAG: twin-arginine translocase TatA/TatE family subunit [Ktedonobacteraceae bacterium]